MQAIKHNGFALVDVLQPCVSFNRINTYKFYRERVYKLENEAHDIEDWDTAFTKAKEWGKRIPIGVFYKEKRPPYRNYFPVLKKGPLVKQSLERNMDEFLREFM
jgi:2-oxoglutarate ferredoxin oxidoreductase subunit beta